MIPNDLCHYKVPLPLSMEGICEYGEISLHDYVISVAKGVCPSEDSFSMIYSNHMGFISREYSLPGSTKGNQRNLKCKKDFFSVAI